MSAGRPSMTARAWVPLPPKARRNLIGRPVASSYSLANLRTIFPYDFLVTANEAKVRVIGFVAAESSASSFGMYCCAEPPVLPPP